MGSDSSDETVGDEVDWRVDAKGRYVFTDDGVTFVLAKDGYAYAEADLGDREVELAVDDDASEPEPAAESSPAQDPTVAIEPVSLGDALRDLDDQDAPARGGLRGRRARAKQAAAEADPTLVAEDAPTAVVAEPSTARASTRAPARATARAGRRGKASAEPSAEVLLRLVDLKSGYGALPVLHGVTVDIRKGETAVLLGLNGAGKTTTALNVCGALRAWSGTIEFDGQDITDWNTRRCVSAGVVMVPEGRRVFPDLTVAKNLQMGAWSQRADGDWLEEGTERVFNYFPRMRERADQLAGTLSGGEQQMLAVGRGLMARPKLLIIDEASMGLAPVIVQDVFDIISQINRDGVTVLLIEQNVGALDVADLGLVMEQGRMVKQLRGARLRDRREVTEVLMG